MNDNFLRTANPFAKLDRRRFPEDRGADAEAQRKAERLQRIKADIPWQFDNDDSAMFLAAIGGTDRRPMKRATVPDEEETEDFAAAMRTAFGRGVKPIPERDTPSVPKAPAHPKAAAPALPSTPDDADTLFAEAMQDVRRFGASPTVQAPKPTPVRIVPATAPKSQESKDIAFTVVHGADYVEGHVVGLDLTTVARLQQGADKPELPIDLHGLDVRQACEQMVRTVRNAYDMGRRILLVVYGRGRHSPTGYGVLREKVPQWLTQEPFKYVISAFCTAGRTDGGAGALYVLLRKKRKDSPRIPWDLRPPDADLYI